MVVYATVRRIRAQLEIIVPWLCPGQEETYCAATAPIVFLQRDAQRGLCYRKMSVRPFICPSVTRLYCVKNG